MTDTYLVSSSFDAITNYCAQFADVIGPLHGTAATQDITLEDGSFYAAQPACGDPAMWYACIRDGAVNPIGDVSACDSETGKAVCGVWA